MSHIANDNYYEHQKEREDETHFDENKGIVLSEDVKNTFKECEQYFTNPKIRQDFKDRVNKFLFLN